MKVLVTGGSGFIGSHVVDKLRDKGFEVRVFDMVVPERRDDLEFYQGSLLDFESLRMAMHSIDAVVHLAAVADVNDVFTEPHYAESINVRGTINVLEAARRSKLGRVIYGSTTWVYGDTHAGLIDEDTPLSAPSHLYTATKLAGEYYCQSYSRLYEMPVTILRYGIPYGPRGRDRAVIPAFVRQAVDGGPIKITGDGLQFRQFVYVEDLAEGNVLALRDVARNRVYNLDGSEQITIRQVAETVQRLVGNVGIEFGAARPGDFSGKVISSERAERELGWRATTPLEEGVRRYIEWYRSRQERRDRAQERIETFMTTPTGV
jgi:UDP-glucose 4-epimerase